jgi:hypothetical protein
MMLPTRLLPTIPFNRQLADCNQKIPDPIRDFFFFLRIGMLIKYKADNTRKLSLLKEVLGMEKEKSLSESNKSKSDKDLFGLEPKMSLQSVHFAPSENSLLNEGAEKHCD